MDRRIFLQRSSIAACGGALQASGLPRLANASRSPNAPSAPCPVQVGCALTLSSLGRFGNLKQSLLSDVTLITPENAMKWPAIHPSPDAFFFTEVDRYFAFASANHLHVRGHNLCWNEDSLPAWFKTDLNRANATSVLTRHIETVAGRYAGRVQSWDVVNESVKVSDKRADGLSVHPWTDLLGPEYIDLAFHTARAADPVAPLVLNEVAMEADTPYGAASRAALLKHLRSLRQRGVPVQVLGLESHIKTETPLGGADFTNFLRSVKDLGLEVYITELDVDDTHTPGSVEQRQAAVADQYKRYLDLVIPIASPPVIVFWSYMDGNNWLDWLGNSNQGAHRADGQIHRPGLRGEDQRPTPALARIRQAIEAHCSAHAN